MIHYPVLIGDDLRCTYHGWTYKRDGACVHIPAPGTAAAGSASGTASEIGPGCDRVSDVAEAIGVEVWNGMKKVTVTCQVTAT